MVSTVDPASDLSEVTTSDYTIDLEQFQGPLDLLLTLIEGEKLDITQLALAKITDQYLHYIEDHADLPPESLVDFLVIASQLMVIKSKALLPMLVLEDEEEIDSRLLELRLRELKLFRMLADGLTARLEQKLYLVERPFVLQSTVQFIAPPTMDRMVLAASFAGLLTRLPQEEQMEQGVVHDVVSLKDKIASINRNLKIITRTKFHKLLGDKASKTEVIVSFLAILELMKQRILRVKQNELFGEIELERIEDAIKAGL